MKETHARRRRWRRGGRPRTPKIRRFRPFHTLVTHIERTFVAGILVALPIAVTILVLKFFFDLLSPILRPNLNFIPFAPRFPGFGLVVVLALVYIAGLVASHVVGRRLVNLTHHLFEAIPVVKSIYGTTRTAVDLLSNTSRDRPYSGVVLVPFPHPGIMSIGLVTSRLESADGEPLLAVYLPTTPIPSSGYMVILPEKNTTPTDISVDDAMKMVVSGGILAEQVFRRHKFVAGEKTSSNQ